MLVGGAAEGGRVKVAVAVRLGRVIGITQYE